MVSRWTKQELNILKENYGKMSEVELSNLLPQRTAPAIRMMTEKIGIRKRQKVTFFNENFFSVPNTINSYWAGFIAADGNVNSKWNKLSIIVSEKDKDHILKFANDINYNGKFISRTRSFNNNDSPKQQFGIQVNGAKKLISDLKNNFNIIDKKSLILEPPNLQNNDNKLAYIVGYIDGDGSIGKAKRYNRSFLSIRGTYNILEWIQKNIYGINRISSNGGQFIITWGGKTADKIIEYLLDIEVPRLGRKWVNYGYSRKNFTG